MGAHLQIIISISRPKATACIVLLGVVLDGLQRAIFGVQREPTVTPPGLISDSSSLSILFPIDIFEDRIMGSRRFLKLAVNRTLLPGAFIGYLLRFDRREGRSSIMYFSLSLTGYVLDSVSTFFIPIECWWLPIGPFCVGLPLCVAFFKGHIWSIWSGYMEIPARDGRRG